MIQWRERTINLVTGRSGQKVQHQRCTPTGKEVSTKLTSVRWLLYKNCAENKNTLRTPDNTPPRPVSLPYYHELPPRQLAFGPIGSHLKSSLEVSAAYSPLQKIPHNLLKPVGSPLQIGTLSDTSKFYQKPSPPQPTPKSASYRPPNPFPPPSANLASLDLSLSPLLAPGVVHFP